MGNNRGFFREMLGFVFKGKRWWLLPVIIAMLVAGILIIFAQSSAVSPFIYALF
jgi:hypothetical protein